MLDWRRRDHLGRLSRLNRQAGWCTKPFTAAQSQAGWRLEESVVHPLLECETGYIADGPNDNGLNYIFNRRSGPISAALAVTLDAP